MDVCCGIYAITCVTTGKLYIGSACDCWGRLRVHTNKLKKQKHVNCYLQSAWLKYGEDKFEFKILEVCSEEELKAKEQWWINTTKSSDRRHGFNLQHATRQESPASYMSKIGKEYWQSLTDDEHAARNAYKWTDEGRAILKQNVVKQWADPEFRKTMPKKVSATMKKLCETKEARARLTVVSNIYWKDPEAREKARQRMKLRWQNMSPEEREARTKKLGRKRKHALVESQ